MTVGQRIKQLRQKRYWSKNRLAREMDITYSHNISVWENDQAEPRLYAFFKLCRALNISMDEFMKGVDLE